VFAGGAGGRKDFGGGYLTTLGGQPRNHLGRLNADGTLDSGFNPGASGGSYPFVNSLAVQADGKILVGGVFTTLGGQMRNSIGRLNADGTLDSTFNPGADSAVTSLAVQADGKILVGGDFSTLGGQPRNHLGRLNASDPATQSLNWDGSAITWLRGGSSPEVWRTTFGCSTNGTDWMALGEGTRIAGGWKLSGVSLPGDGTIRAHGHVTGGQYNASSWFVEAFSGAPVLITHPASRTNDAGTTAMFSVLVGGTEPLAYQWYINGLALADGGNILGAHTSRLGVSNVLGGDTGGGYSVVISNAQGNVTSLVAMLTVVDPVITAQPATQNRERGESATLSVTAAGTPPLSYQWWKDGVAVSSGTAPSVILTNLQAANAGNYDVVVSNVFGSVTSAVAALSVNLATPDPFNPGASSYVGSVAVQADRKILVGGDFTTLGGQPRSYLGRLNPDGTLESTFNPGANDYVSSLVVQADRKILVGGNFTTLGGQPRNRVGRLNADGTLDSTFTPVASDAVYSLAVQADGKVLVGGSFTALGGQPRNYLGRLNADGTLDPTFNLGAGGDYPSVASLAVQADGKILVGGYFTALGEQPRNSIGRLNADGTLDDTFNPRVNSYGDVYSLTVQADGKILVGGSFYTLGGQPRNSLGRLNADGTLDSTFNPGASSSVSSVYSLAVQTDGKILVGGFFTTLGGQTGNYLGNYLGRLNADGTPDTTFNLGADWTVFSLAVQADGKILVGGAFTTLGEQSRNRLGRLNASDPATQSLNWDGSAITWLRGGTSPEVWRTTFDCSTNGTDWMTLGEGTRIAGGWQLSGVSIPGDGTIRARGQVTGGTYNGSSWFVESTTLLGRPVILSHPHSRTNNAGTMASFSVVASGSEPLGYQWFKGEVALTNGGNIAGALTASLTVSNILKSDEGGYSVVVSNFSGSVTSAVAVLTVHVPLALGTGTAPRFSGGEFRFDVTGPPGQIVLIEGSTNLQTWLQLWTNTLGSGPLYFSDPDSAGISRRFYRARLWP
jgi:uncharacterized delta-60 repeat protein